MHVYDLYGFYSKDIDNISIRLSKLLKAEFEAHESLFLGEYYRCDQPIREAFILRKNIDPLDQEPAEKEFSSYPVILYTNDLEQPDQIRRVLLNGMVDEILFLRREVI